MVVAVSKVDLLPSAEREERLERLRRRILKVLAGTRFAGAEIICLSSVAGSEISEELSKGLPRLVEAINARARPLSRDEGPFKFAIDHCFAVRGHGTVLTGTVLSGAIAVGDLLELPALGVQRRVKSMQMFHQPRKTAVRGDRVGICVTGLEAQLVERGLACAPDSVPSATAVVCLVRKVRFFRAACATKSKLHVSLGHATELATCSFFGAKELGHLGDLDPRPDFSLDDDFEFQAELAEGEAPQWALVEFGKPVLCSVGGLVIGSKLDIDVKGSSAEQCRIAFHGHACRILSHDEVARVKVFTWRLKEGTVDRISEVRDGLCLELVGSGLFSGGGIRSFLGLRVRTESGYVGVISGAYGNDGCFKVRFENGARQVRTGSRLTLRLKRYANDDKRTMRQGEERDEPRDLGIPDECQTEDVPPVSATHSKKKSMRAGRSGQPAPVSDQSVPQSAVTSVFTGAEAAVSGTRRGVIESIKEESGESGERLVTAIVSGLFRMDENIRAHVGRAVTGPGNEVGEIRGPFGKMGKCKVLFSNGFSRAANSPVQYDE